MKERPILFSGDMVRAILEGHKTMTRRVIKDNALEFGINWIWNPNENRHLCPYSIGDRLIPAISIQGYDIKYCADVLGRIWSKASGEWKVLKGNKTCEYLRLTLRKDGKDVNRTIHKLVCEAFYGKPSFAKPAVRHLDGNSLNNSPENLDWGTYSQNWDDRKVQKKGINENHHNAKITMEIAIKMRLSGESAWSLSKKYGVSPKTIQRVLKNETWKESFDDPQINMPRSASRITLEVTGVKVERLQQISAYDLVDEGVEKFPPTCLVELGKREDEMRNNFQKLWDSINANRPGCSWAENPWVWVVEFKRVPQ